jgi:hypothetical protein
VIRAICIRARPRKLASVLSAVCRLILAALFACTPLPGAWAGGGSFGDPDDHAHDEGPGYFGFVKDERGVPIRDAKVTASYKTSLSFVARSNVAGAYRLRGFKNDVNPKDVTISCAKEGYKQIRIFRRPLQQGRPIKAVETECRMQKL